MRPLARLALFGSLLVAVLVGAFVLGRAADPVGLARQQPEPEGHGAMAEDVAALPPGLVTAGADLRLDPAVQIVPAGTPSPYAFRILDASGQPVRRFDIEHTRPMHLILVRRDMTGFVHDHPTMSADGTWTTTLTLPDAGPYRAFADFAVDGEKRTLGADLFVPGDFRPVPVPSAAPTADAGGGYTVALSTPSPAAGAETTLDFTVAEDGAPVTDIPPYLGAAGHLVVLRSGDLAYLHTHADTDRLAFEVTFPTPGDYRLFLQFLHGGEVRTAAFTVHVEADAR